MRAPLLTGLLAMGLAGVASAQDATMALRPETLLSWDADGNEVRKVGVGWDWTRTDREHWRGVHVEQARFSGDSWSHTEQRVYARAAGTFGVGEVTDDSWRWQFKIGSNGHTVLGSASLHTEGSARRELFLERELLETEAGVTRRQMVDFAGAAIDVPLSERWSTTGLVGLQDFSGGNLRTHLRGNVVFAALPEAGVSLQLRTRYYRNSDPYLGGYYSPPWYGEALGVVGVRRVIGGHIWRAAAGVGRQRSADDDAKRARLLEVGYESPRWRQSWLRVAAGYTDTPVATASGAGSYSYRYLMVESVVAF